MTNHLRHIALLGILLWLTASFLIVGNQEVILKDRTAGFTISDTDLSRVEWRMDHFSNPGFEDWSTDHSISDLTTSRTTEDYTWYAQSPWPVYEGDRSRGFQARAIDSDHPSDSHMSRTTWPHWDNPTNLTLKFDWYIDSLPQPTDSDYFVLNIELGKPSDVQMYYYFNCEDTMHSNSSNYMYFFIDGPAQTWNTFDRNITEDFYEIALDHYPTEFHFFTFNLHTESSAYARAFLDDLWMSNGTVIFGGSTGNGNFEANSGWSGANYNSDAADISRSPVRQEGEWSLNATANSNGNMSRLSISYYPNRRLSPLNPDTFSFQWRMEDFQGANEDTFAYVQANCENESDSFTVFYVLAYGDNTNSFTWEGSLIINVPGFNTTGQWNSFSQSIWDDISSFNESDYYVINEIEIIIRARGPTSRISILFDEMKFEAAGLDDMGYEDQPAVGEMALSWSARYGPTPEFTVTGTTHSGSKAANLTVVDGSSWSGESYYENRPINQFTDTWLDFYWMIADSSEHTENLIYLELYFESEDSLGYILANYTDVPTANGFDEFIVIPEANTEGVWYNFQRNLYDDYIDAFGTIPDTELTGIYLYSQADTGGRLEVLFDDVYLYDDPAPGFSDIYFTPTMVDVDVNVSTQVFDLSLETVTLYYRIDEGTWIEMAMVQTDGWFNATIPGQTYDTEVDFYIEATDAFEQTSQTVQIGYTIPGEHQPPPLNLVPLVVTVVGIAIVGLIVIYFLVVKPKQVSE